MYRFFRTIDDIDLRFFVVNCRQRKVFLLLTCTYLHWSVFFVKLVHFQMSILNKKVTIVNDHVWHIKKTPQLSMDGDNAYNCIKLGVV